MVSPVLRRVPALEYRIPPTEKKAAVAASVITPNPPSEVETPSTIGRITPTRRMLFDRVTARDAPSVSLRSSIESIESSQEIEDLRLSCQKKDDQIRSLHQRFHTIQQGLGSIDQERTTLVEKAKKLEKEKRQIQRQLEVREQEILALVQRCASQEEKMRESTRLRSQNRELAQALETIQRQTSNDDQEREDLRTLNQKLKDSELAREQLQERLRKVQREHDSIADALQSCLEKIRQLTEEKEAAEDDHCRERKRVEMEMERQRLDHVQVSNELKDDIEIKQRKIEQMERKLQETMNNKTTVRRGKTVGDLDPQEVLAGYEKKIAQLQEELVRRSVIMDEGYRETLVLLQKKIEEKDALMEVLEQEFSGQMGELMKKQSSLDEAEQEKKTLETKIQKLERLECQYSALEEYVRILDSNLADLTSENAHLMLSKESLEEETRTLQGLLQELQAQLGRVQKDSDGRDGYTAELTSDQREELRAEIEAALTEAQSESELLRVELASSERSVANLEDVLGEARRTISQKETEITRLQQEKEDIQSNLQASLSKSMQEVGRLEARLTFQEQKLHSRQQILIEKKEKYGQQVAHVRKLERRLLVHSPSRGLIDAELGVLRTQVDETIVLIESLQQHIHDIEDDTASRENLGNETKARKAELERDLQNAQIHLRTLQEEIYSLQLTQLIPGHSPEDVVHLESQSEEPVHPNAAEVQELENKLDDARSALDAKQSEIDELHSELAVFRIEKGSLLDALEEANTNIKSLQSKVRDHVQEHLETELESALTALSDQVSKTRKIEEDYASAVRVRSEREAHSRQASSRVVILEKQVVELKGVKADLKEKLREWEKAVESKDRQLRLFQLESEEWENRVSLLRGNLDEESNRRKSLENEVSKKNKINNMIQTELDESTKERAMFEKRIKEMDQALMENHRARLNVEHELANSSSQIVAQNEEIGDSRSMVQDLQNQLQAARNDLAENGRMALDTERKLAEKVLEFSQMEKECEFATQSRQKTADRLAVAENRLAALEEEAISHLQSAEGWKTEIEESSSKLNILQADKITLEGTVESLQKQLAELSRSSEEKIQALESQHAKACNSLFDKQAQIESMESTIQNVNDELTSSRSQLSDAKEAIEVLTKDNSTRERRIESLTQELDDVTKSEHDVKTAFSESEEKRSTLEKMLQQAMAKNEEIVKDLETRGARVQEMDEIMQESIKEKAAMSEAAEFAAKKCEELEDRINDLNKLIDSREAQLYACGNNLNLSQTALSEAMEESTNLKAVVKSLEIALSETTFRSKSIQEELEIHLVEERARYDQASAKLASIQTMLSDQRQKSSRYQAMVSEQDDKIEALTSELRETVASKDKAFKAMEKDLMDQILKLETGIALKDDEIQELRVVDLQDKEETIVSLSDELRELRESAQANQDQLTKDLKEAKDEVATLRGRVTEQEDLANTSSKAHKEEIRKMESRIQELDDAKHKAEAQIGEQEDKLRDRSTVISQMSRREAELEKQELVLLASSQQLVESEVKLKHDLEKMKMALDVQIIRARESLDYQRQEMEAKARKERGDMSYKIRSIEIKLGESETMLKDRTSLLSEMVEHNRDLECRLEKQQAQIDTMEEETSRCRLELSEAQSELMHSREELCKRESVLTAKLNEERSHRDNAERSLSTMKAHFKEAALAKKTIADLERDNKSLKDKIVRQEAFLQRKLDKEKHQRGRSTPVSSSASTSSSRTPSKLSSPKSIVLHPPPRIVRASPVKKDLSSTSFGSTTANAHTNDSIRSSRSISSVKTVPRSSIPSPSTTSISSTKIESRNTSNTGRDSSAAPINDNHSFEPIQRDSWDLDLE